MSSTAVPAAAPAALDSSTAGTASCVEHGLDEILHHDVVLYSPVGYTPQQGKAIVATYLSAAKATFAAVGFDADIGPSFRYVKHLSGDAVVVEFETEMGGKYVNGVDIIRVDDAGRIVEFRVMVRPLQAHAVHELMGAELAAMAAAGGDGGS